MEDAFCMMTSFIKESSYGAGETSRNNQPPPLASFIPFYLHLYFLPTTGRSMIEGRFQIFPLEHGFLTVCEKQWARAFFAINGFIPS